MMQESLILWLKRIICALIIALWTCCFGLLCTACWIRNNLSPIVVVAEGTSVGDFYLISFFPVMYPVLIAVSCLLLVIGCLGSCGSFTENRAMLGWFFFSVLITFCIEISAGVWGMRDWNTVHAANNIEILYENAQKYGEYGYSWFTKAWEKIHNKFECCGIQSFHDWDHTAHNIQASCCKSDNCQNEEDFEGVPGCGEILLEYLRPSRSIHIIPYLSTVIGIIQVVCLILTAKLWMVLCFRKKPFSSNSNRQIAHTQNTITMKKDSIPSLNGCQIPPSNNNTVMADQRYIPMNALPYNKLAYSEFDIHGHSYCHQCAMRAYEKMRLLSTSALESQFHQQNEHSRRNLMGAGSCSGGHLGQTSSKIQRNVDNTPYVSHNIRKSVSSHIPVAWSSRSRSSSWASMQQKRVCHSAGLPRKKFDNVPTWRRQTSRNFIQRLSTIRASGVAVESDNDSSENERLGNSRCYNTEAECFPSDLDNDSASSENSQNCNKSVPEVQLNRSTSRSARNNSFEINQIKNNKLRKPLSYCKTGFTTL